MVLMNHVDGHGTVMLGFVKTLHVKTLHKELERSSGTLLSITIDSGFINFMTDTKTRLVSMVNNVMYNN
jgi:hypothetical protein